MIPPRPDYFPEPSILPLELNTVLWIKLIADRIQKSSRGEGFFQITNFFVGDSLPGKEIIRVSRYQNYFHLWMMGLNGAGEFLSVQSRHNYINKKNIDWLPRNVHHPQCFHTVLRHDCMKTILVEGISDKLTNSGIIVGHQHIFFAFSHDRLFTPLSIPESFPDKDAIKTRRVQQVYVSFCYYIITGLLYSRYLGLFWDALATPSHPVGLYIHGHEEA